MMTINVNQRFNRFWLLIVSILLAVGCSSDVPPLEPVTGVVLMKGKPLPGVEITFSPRPHDGGAVPKSSRAITDDSGRYTLNYLSADGKTRAEGAALGEHVVCFSDYLSIESRDNPIAYRFSVDLAKTGLTPFTATVVEGEQEFNFDLTKYPNKR